MNDGGLFLDRWGNEALSHGWTVGDLFGLDPTSPMARYGQMGLVLLKLTPTDARLDDGLVFRR
jgi:hypothetical protein